MKIMLNGGKTEAGTAVSASESKTEAGTAVSASESKSRTNVEVEQGPTVASALSQLRALKSQSRPVAMVGFKEWIFSHKSGALGSFAAAAEVRLAGGLFARCGQCGTVCG
jgi:hypothetical protein